MYRIGGNPPYAQVRMVAMIDEIKEPTLDPDTGKIYGRILTDPNKAIEKLSWGKIGKLLIEEAVRLAEVNFGIKEFLDKDDVATFETTSDNYEIYNIEGNFSYAGKQTMLMKLGVRNLFNTTYINHLSNLKGIGLPSPGINFYISINYLFN